MRNRITTREPDIINNQKINTLLKKSDNSYDIKLNNPVSEIINAEGGENIIDYIEWLGLDKDPNLVVLSSLHHYYYDAEEMKNVKTLINLKELNQIDQIKNFLHSIFHLLPPKSNYIGCFIDYKTQTGKGFFKNKPSVHQSKKISEALDNGILSRVPVLNKLFSLMDLKTNKYLSRKSVTLMLEDHGFKILDMTELNGLTYFHSQKVHGTNN